MQLSRDRPPGPQAAVRAASPWLLSTRPLDVALDAGSSTSAAMRFHISTGHEQGSYSAQACRAFVVRRSSKILLVQSSSLGFHDPCSVSVKNELLLCPLYLCSELRSTASLPSM